MDHEPDKAEPQGVSAITMHAICIGRSNTLMSNVMRMCVRSRTPREAPR